MPENTDVSAEDEMRNVLLWSDDNKLSVNLSKCKIVFRRPNVKHDILPDPLADVERVSCAKLLGVFIDCRLKFTEHVDLDYSFFSYPVLVFMVLRLSRTLG